MVLPRFKYYKPVNNEELFKLLDEYSEKNVKLLAGGTDLLPTMRAGKLSIDCMIDISSLGINKICEKDNSIHIGAMVTFRQLIFDDLINAKFPALVNAAKSVGAVQTRSLATIGGNICSAVPSCDSAPILIALGAKLLLCDPNGKRIIPVEEFFKGPRCNVLNCGEFLSEIIIPLPKNDAKSSFMKFGRRKALTLAIVNGAVMIELDKDQKVLESRIALGAVGPVPIRTYKAEKFLAGKQINQETIAKAAEIAASEISPISDIRASAEYRTKMSIIIVKRAIKQCI